MRNIAVVTSCCVHRQVTGVYFESKVDYTTWFGDNVEYIHGIQVMTHNGLFAFRVSSAREKHGHLVND